jgi:hypothetical protein
MNIIKKKYINKLLDNSKIKILNYKLESMELYDLIYKFCKDNSVILSNNNINLSIISNNKFVLNDINTDFTFNILSANPYKDAINLSNIIYLHYSKYVTVNSFIDNKEITISVDNMKIIKFYLLFIPKKISNLEFFINTTDIKILNTTYKIKYTNNLIELLILSYKLYHPQYFLKFIKEDPCLFDNNFEHIYIYNQLVKTLTNESNIKGGKYIIKISNIRKEFNRQLIKNINDEEFNNINIILLENDFNNLNYNKVLHMIMYSKYIPYLKKLMNLYINTLNDKNYKLVSSESNIYVINDFRYKKIQFKLINLEKNEKIVLLNIYNSIDYELIPIIETQKNILIPHPLVIIRYSIINLINSYLFDTYHNNDKLVLTLSIIKNSHNKILYIYKNLDNIKIYYYGVFIDEKIDMFKYPNKLYRPWQYFLKNDKLLNIT